MAERVGCDIVEKVAPRNQHVSRDRQLHAGCGRKQRAIVADAEHGARGRVGTCKVLCDQAKFGQHAANLKIPL